MSPGSNKRPTGTVPKAKSSRKNTVPQEMVTPTRRDLHQHLNEFLASVQQTSKNGNNRTPAEGTCFEIETTRSCWPVRPIPRRNFSHEPFSETNAVTSSACNTTIGVVIPTTPNSTLHHQQQNHINEQLQQNSHQQNILNARRSTLTPDYTMNVGEQSQLLTMRVPDGAPQSMSIVNNLQNPNVLSTASKTGRNHQPSERTVNGNFDDRLSQIQDYIQITTSLLHSINTDGNAPRPQSVASVHTSAPNTPTYEELQNRLEASVRNIQQIKEQQNQLLRLQQAAKNNLYEMEQNRAQQNPVSFANNPNGGPDYETVADVQSDIRTLMARMKNITDFVHNQNELASSLGDEDKADVIDEQIRLQKKLEDLKTKKSQMSNLVNELHSMNTQPGPNFDGSDASTSRENERQHSINNSTLSTNGANDLGADEIELDFDGATGGEQDMIRDKIAEINSMKNQLKRLQDMMHTVKLIEIKNGDRAPDDNSSNDKSENVRPIENDSTEDNQHQEAEELEMAERVRALHDMTNDLRHQAASLAAERDRLKVIKNHMPNRRDYDGNEKNVKQPPFQQSANVLPKDDNENDLDSILTVSGRNWATPARSNSRLSSVQRELDSNSSKPTMTHGKSSIDSGAGDILNVSVDAGSLQSESSRAFSVPPPMRTMISRTGPWRKSSQEISRVSSGVNHPQNQPFENQTEQHSPCYWHNSNSCYGSYSNGGPQSPHCPCFHHGNDQHYCRSSCGGGGQPQTDPMLIQQFIQTQQMIINSVSQCNQLLWEQQREINNLNSAVLLLQERFLNANNANMSDAAQANVIRAESVPPNIVCTNTSAFLPRAQSEQPNFPSSFRQYTPSTGNGSPYLRNVSIGAAIPVRIGRNNPLIGGNQRSGSPSFYDTTQPTSQYTNNLHLNNDLNSTLPNNASSPQRFIYHNNNTTGNSNNANLNNQHHQNVASSISDVPGTSSGLRLITSNHGTNSTNTNRIYSPLPPSQTHALNNQVAPGNRANNYWDNFKSYSRQNLLSANKTNEDYCQSFGNGIQSTSTTSAPSQNRDRSQLPPSGQNTSGSISIMCSGGHSRNAAPSQMTHNNLPSMANAKYSFRNQINQQHQQHSNTPDVLNINQDQQQLYLGVVENNFNNLNLSQSSNGPAEQLLQNIDTNNQPILLDCNVSDTIQSNSLSGLHATLNNISTFNFDINESKLPKTSIKIIPKCSTGGSKRIRHTRSDASMAIDLNLSNTTNSRLDNKSTSDKLFDDLKENVYLEVSALIAANESRPEFLINLFRELQLISTSDPLRKRLMEAFQELYSQYCDASGRSEPSLLQATNLQNENLQILTHSIDANIFTDADVHNQRNAIDLNAQSVANESMLDALMTNINEVIEHDSGNGNGVSRSTIHNIANVIIWNLNDTDSNNETFNPSQHKHFDDIVKHLMRFDRYNNQKFLGEIQNYLTFLVTHGIDNESENNPKMTDSRIQYENKIETNNEMSSTKGKNTTSIASTSSSAATTTATTKSSQFVMNVFSSNNVGHVMSQIKNQSNSMVQQSSMSLISDNQELAEADQIRNNDNGAVNTLSQTEPDEIIVEIQNIENINDDIDVGRSIEPNVIGNLSNIAEIVEDIGAVGGIASSQLPDLAKVTTQTASTTVTTARRNSSHEHDRTNSETFSMERINRNNSNINQDDYNAAIEDNFDSNNKN